MTKLSDGETTVLQIINEMPDSVATIDMIAARMGLKARSVAGICAHLKQRGLIQSEGSHRIITALGRAALKEER